MPSQEVQQRRPQPGTDVIALEQRHRAFGATNPDQPAATTGVDLEPVASESDDRITFVVSGVTEGSERQSARQSAHREYDNDMAAEGGRLRRFARNMIKGNFLREGLLARNRNRAQQRIDESGRLDDMTEAQWQDVTAESIQRVIDDQGTGEYLHQGAGERRDELEGENGQSIRDTMNQLLTEFVGGHIDRNNLQAEARRRLVDVARNNPNARELIGAGSVYMTNIIEIADTVQAQANHERGLQSVLDRIDYVSARVKTNAHTEARASNVEKFLDHTPFGTSAIASVGLATAYGLGVGFGKSMANRLTRFGIVSVGSGVMAYFQEKSRLAYERAQVARENELGEAVDGSERRDRLNDTMYDTRQATVLTEALRSLRTNDTYDITTPDQFTALSAAVADLTARHDLSGIDLRNIPGFEGRREQIVSFITHTSTERRPAEVREMMAERFRARAALRRHFEAQQQADPGFMGGVTFDAYMGRTAQEAGEGLLQNVAEQDSNYDALSRELARKSALKGFVFGSVMGVAMQEGLAGLNSHVEGLYEYLKGTKAYEGASSALAYAARAIKGELNTSGVSGGELKPLTFAAHDVGGRQIEVSDNLTFKAVNDHQAEIVSQDGKTVRVNLDKGGAVTAASIADLRAQGFTFTDTTGTQPTMVTTETTMSAREYTSQHGTEVHRSWFDNDTPAPKFDLNELGLHLKMGDNGDHVFDVRSMVEGGSFHGGREADLDYSNMRMLLSPSENTQCRPIVIEFGSDGRAIIPKGSAAAQLFDGEGKFIGRFAEVAQVDGMGDDGSMNVTMLATVEGQGYDGKFTVDEMHRESVLTHDIKIGYPNSPEEAGFADIPAVDADIEIPPVISLAARGGLREQADGDNNAEPEVPPVPPAPREVREETGGGGRSESPVSPEQSQEQNDTSNNGGAETATGSQSNTSPAGAAGPDRQLEGRPAQAAQEQEDELAVRREAQARERDQQRTARESQAESARQAAAELVDENGQTPRQLAEQHPQYADALARLNSATDRSSSTRARREATRVLRRLEGYYERMIREQKGLQEEVTYGDNVHEQATKDPRYVSLQREGDELFALEEEALKQSRATDGLSDIDRQRLNREYLVAARNRAEHDRRLAELKAQILIELNRQQRTAA